MIQPGNGLTGTPRFETTIHSLHPVAWCVAYHRDLYWVQDYIPCSFAQFQTSSNDMASTITATLMTFKYICSVKIQMWTYMNALLGYKTQFPLLAIA